MSGNWNGKGVIDLRPYFGLTKADKQLPEEIGALNFERFYKKLRNEEKYRLDRFVIFALRSKIKKFGHASGIELAGKLGCWLLIHDPHNTCLKIYLKRRKENFPP